MAGIEKLVCLLNLPIFYMSVFCMPYALFWKLTGVITRSSFAPFTMLFEPCALLCPFLLLPLLFIPPLHLYLLYSTVFGLHSWFHAFSLRSSKFSSLSIVLFCLLFDLLSLNQLDHDITVVHAIPFFFFYVSYSS